MKKIIITVLLAAATLNLVACGSSSKNKEVDTTISVQVEKAWLPYYEKVRERVLEKNPGATINFVETASFDHLDIIDSTDSTNKDVADVFSIPADRLYKLANNNVLAAIDGKAMAEDVGGFKDYDAGLGGNFKKDGEYLAFPYNIETLVAYVNIDNAKKLGIDTTKKIEFTQLGYESMLALVHDAWYGVAFANSAGFELLAKDSDGKLITDTSKEFKDLTDSEKKLFEALFNYWKSHNENKTDLWDKTAAGGYLDSKFVTGQTNAIRIDGPWAAASLAERAGSEENLQVLPLNQITVNGNELSHWKGGWGLAINSRIEEDDAKMALATSLIEEIVNPTYAQDLFKATGKILENVEPSAYEGIDKMNKVVIDATYESYKTAVARPLFTEWDSVWTTWQNALLSWSNTNPKNAEEAYNQVKSGFDAMMTNFK
jgi:arabinogalactan oligomer/maltooligosaccharide transport system substrate-binding protein